MIYVNKVSCWAPLSGALKENPGFWLDWANGKASLALSGASPKLAYADPLFRRRLSQITKMTIEVVHDIVSEVAADDEESEVAANPLVCDGSDEEEVSSGSIKDAKLVFCSFRGEIARQLKINRGLIEERDVSPASFAISVFNTPPASAAIALDLKAGYTAIYPGSDDFSCALACAFAPILCGKEKRVIFAFADELIPQEYVFSTDGTVGTTPQKPPLAFALALSERKTRRAVELNLSERYASPEDFLKAIICQTTK